MERGQNCGAPDRAGRGQVRQHPPRPTGPHRLARRRWSTPSAGQNARMPQGCATPKGASADRTSLGREAGGDRTSLLARSQVALGNAPIPEVVLPKDCRCGKSGHNTTGEVQLRCMSATKCKGDLGGCQAHAANLEHIPRPARAGHPLQKGDMGCMTPRPCLFSRPLLSSRHGPGLHAPPLRHRRVPIPHDSTVTDSRPSGAILPVSAAWRKQCGGMWHGMLPVRYGVWWQGAARHRFVRESQANARRRAFCADRKAASLPPQYKKNVPRQRITKPACLHACYPAIKGRRPSLPGPGSVRHRGCGLFLLLLFFSNFAGCARLVTQGIGTGSRSANKEVFLSCIHFENARDSH